MTTQAQPDIMPVLKLRMDEVTCVEAPGSLSPSTIISSGANFYLRTDISFEGTFGVLLSLMGYRVEHHLEPIQTGAAAISVPGGSLVFNLPPAPPFHFQVTGGPIKTGTGPGDDVPPGTYRVLTHLHLLPPWSGTALVNLVGGFHEGLIIEVLPAV